MDTSRLGLGRGLCLCLLALAAPASAATLNIYTENFDAFNDVARNDFGDGVEPYGVFTLTDTPAPPQPASPFGTGNAFRIVDFTEVDKPELHGQLAAPLFEPFRVDFQSFNASTLDTTRAIRFRMGNNGLNLGSERRAAFSVSWQADQDIGAKYSGALDGIGDVDTQNTPPLDPGIYDVTMIANGALAGTYTYDLFGEVRTLDPLHYDLYINGELLNESEPGDDKHDDFKNGMQFHFDKSDSEYDPALGLQQFMLASSGTSDTGPDVYFDNIILTTGADIGNRVPEPTALATFATALALASSTWRRK